MSNKPGFCVYYFAHRGIGRIIEETKNMKTSKNKIISGGDAYNIVCDSDKKTAIKKYNNLRKTKTKQKRLSGELKNKSFKKKKKHKPLKKKSLLNIFF
jgi:hypothetical protein